jgi:uncharacterized protein YaaW (UPF0174 family)
VADYKDDKDLKMLEFSDDTMLKVLSNYLIFDKDGKKRISESLSDHASMAQANETGDYKQAWKTIATELQCYGGDSLVNLFRSSGVLYKEILTDACSKMSVKYDKKDTTEDIEKKLLAHLFEDAWKDMSESERQEFQADLGINGKLFGPAALAAITASIKAGGFASYQVAMVIANSVAKAITGKGLQLAVNAGIARYMAAFAGPVGIILTILTTIPAITGTAYRVTIPAVIQIAAMRQQLLQKDHF